MRNRRVVFLESPLSHQLYVFLFVGKLVETSGYTAEIVCMDAAGEGGQVSVISLKWFS